MNFALVATFIAAIGLFTYLCIPKGRFKVAGTITFIALASSAFALAFETAGQPKPIAIEWREMAALPVIGFFPNQAEQIVYFWVVRDGTPMSYAYPWPSDGDVERLQDRWRKLEPGDEFYLVEDPSEIAEVRRPPPQPPKEFER